MKVICVMTLAGVLGSTTAFAELSTSETERIQKAAEVVVALRQAPDKGIPEELWSKLNASS